MQRGNMLGSVHYKAVGNGFYKWLFVCVIWPAIRDLVNEFKSTKDTHVFRNHSVTEISPSRAGDFCEHMAMRLIETRRFGLLEFFELLHTVWLHEERPFLKENIGKKTLYGPNCHSCPPTLQPDWSVYPARWELDTNEQPCQPPVLFNPDFNVDVEQFHRLADHLTPPMDEVREHFTDEMLRSSLNPPTAADYLAWLKDKDEQIRQTLDDYPHVERHFLSFIEKDSVIFQSLLNCHKLIEGEINERSAHSPRTGTQTL